MKIAVVRTGGKQYKVREGQLLRVEKLEGDVGQAVSLQDVLLVAEGESNVTIGKPTVVGANVSAEIVAQGKGRKVMLYKSKDGSRGVKRGHRQLFTQLKITSIQA